MKKDYSMTCLKNSDRKIFSFLAHSIKQGLVYKVEKKLLITDIFM